MHMAKDVDKAMEEEESRMEGRKEADESEDIIVCPKCKRPVTEGDFPDQLSLTMADSFVSKIQCPQCGYSGLPIEMSMDDYKKWLKS